MVEERNQVNRDTPPWIEGSTARVITSAGIGHHYRELLRSTVNHCAVHCPETWRRWWDILPPGCPSHEESQYAFKIHALEEPIRSGFQHVLWMDTTFQPIDSIEPLWAHIQETGWFVAEQSAHLGSWTSDRALRIFGISRDEAMEIPLVYSGLVGINQASEVGLKIWERWRELYAAGAFRGPHYNESCVDPWVARGLKWAGHCSNDPRCEGHRHDESALSFVLHELGLKPVAPEWECYGIARHVADYDVVKMRQAILDEGLYIFSDGTLARELCR